MNPTYVNVETPVLRGVLPLNAATVLSEIRAPLICTWLVNAFATYSGAIALARMTRENSSDSSNLRWPGPSDAKVQAGPALGGVTRRVLWRRSSPASLHRRSNSNYLIRK